MALMALDKSFIGRTSAPITWEVEKGHIRRFCEAVGEPNPIYREGERIPAPPTFAIALRPNDVREGMGIDMKKVLHGEQEFEFRRPVYAGDVLTIVQRIADIYEKQGKSGAMDFLVLETIATDNKGETVYTARANVVVRR